VTRLGGGEERDREERALEVAAEGGLLAARGSSVETLIFFILFFKFNYKFQFYLFLSKHFFCSGTPCVPINLQPVCISDIEIEFR
jgi:hypothetical protein